MKKTHPCPSCFLSLTESMATCPNCGKPNPHFAPDTGASEDDAPEPAQQSGTHHAAATAGKCEYCDSVIWSDDKVCPYCGAANPNFVVHGKAQSASAGGLRSHGTTNASTGKCPYCGATVRSNEMICPACGSQNPHYIEDTARVILQPRTIEELKEYCAERDMPLLRMRFFIGEDTYEPMAFGIFKDGSGNTVVYKNKADRSRAVRYSGPDEAYGVNQILTKLKEECRKRGIDPDHSLRGDSGGQTNPTRSDDAVTYANPYTTAGTYIPKNESYKAAVAEYRERENKKKRIVRLILIIGVVAFLVFASLFRTQCSSCMNSCGAFLFGDSSYGGSGSSSNSSYDSGWSWGSDSSDSGWDWGSDSNDWDSWDSGGTDWDSDW